MPSAKKKKRTTKEKEQPARSLADFVALFERAADRLDPKRFGVLWYRGHAQTGWDLTPKLYRDDYSKVLESEDDLRDEFRNLAWPYLHELTAVPQNDWEWLFLMQHFGMPTRLLDWTESALIALYFALREDDPQPDVDAAVWVLSPFRLNHQIGPKIDDTPSYASKVASKHLPQPYSRRKVPSFPIAILPSHKSPRIAAQQGTFTVHGTAKRALNRYPSWRRYCLKIEIDRRDAPAIKEQLRAAGIAETSVFPELAGLSRELVDFYSYSHKS
jgi:hypothetical protein